MLQLVSGSKYQRDMYIHGILGTYLILEESISSCFEEKLCGRYISSLSREEES